MAKVLEDIIIESVCFLFNQKMEKDLGITLPELDASVMFAISMVSHIRETSEDGEILEGKCMVYFKSGDSLLVGMSYKELSEQYAKYYQEK